MNIIKVLSDQTEKELPSFSLWNDKSQAWTRIFREQCDAADCKINQSTEEIVIYNFWAITRNITCSVITGINRNRCNLQRWGKTLYWLLSFGGAVKFGSTTARTIHISLARTAWVSGLKLGLEVGEWQRPAGGYGPCLNCMEHQIKVVMKLTCRYQRMKFLKKETPNEYEHILSLQTLVHGCALMRSSPSCGGPAF